MPFTKREVAVIVADELNRHDRAMWRYRVGLHIDGKRWIIVRNDRELDFVRRHCELRRTRGRLSELGRAGGSGLGLACA